MDEKTEKLERWIRQQMNLNRKDGPLVRLDLVHMGASKQPILFSEEIGSGADSQDLASRIMQEAENDAEGLGGVQRYDVQGFFEKAKTAKAHHRFRLHVADEYQSDSDGYGSEPANAKGHLSQLMRHNEAMFRQTTAYSFDMMRTLAKENEHLRKRCETLEGKFHEQAEAYEELISLQHERELETYKAQRKEERMDEALSTLKMIGPTLVNRLTGKKILPENASPEAAAIDEFMETLDQEQIQKLTTVLKPQQMAVVFGLLEQKLAKDEEKSKAQENGQTKSLPEG